MDKFLGQDKSEQERKSFLADNCDAVEEHGYTRRFSTDELNQKKENLANLSVEINDIEEEKKDAMESYKDRLKPLNIDKKVLLDEIKKKSEFVNEECYKFIDHEEKVVGYYNKLGELVSSRPIMPQEMQKTIFQLKTGTND
ncbi:hypothetical protein [Dysgonomonas capnocytophagoides]|uniref:hypothetical protein n=1 Tax=Dysgonomonas capnocytophagoides TaxID=45254 RepID=UPI003341A8A9